MEPTDKNKLNDDPNATDAAGSDAGLTQGSDPVAVAEGSGLDSTNSDKPGPASRPGSASDTQPSGSSSAAAASGASPTAADVPGSSSPNATDKSASKTTDKTTDKTTNKTTAAAGSTASAGGSGKTPPPSRPKPASGGKGLASLALLVALAAAGLSGWHWYQGQADDESRDAALTERLEQLEQNQQRASDAQLQKLQGLPQPDQWQETQRLIADLQRSQQRLGQQLEQLRGEERTDWKLEEAQYLLRLASLRLLAAQDVSAAQEMLEAVDNILRDQPNSGVFEVREALANVQAELAALPQVDRAGIYLQLAALQDQVDQLVALPVPEFDPERAESAEEAEQGSRIDRILARLQRYVRVDFQRGKVITPLLDEAEMQRIHRTLRLTLEQAQWAALRGEGDVYRRSLERAGEVLEEFFELENPRVQAMQKQLSRLAEREVSLTPPDIAPIQRELTEYMETGGQSSSESASSGNAQEATNE